MDWKSHRIDALLEQALVEDKAASDATTNLTIDPNLRAAGLHHRPPGDGRRRPRRHPALP
jgi:hypothetical protein